MEGIKLFPVLLLSTGSTFLIFNYFFTWCGYSIIPVLLNGLMYCFSKFFERFPYA